MRVLVLHDPIRENAPPDEADTLAQAAFVADVLRANGHDVAVMPAPPEVERLREALRNEAPDAVFNLVESPAGAGRWMHVAALALEESRIPFTGSPANAIFLSNDKPLAKRFLAAHGLPTPAGTDGTDFQPGTYILKPVAEHASLGMTDDRVRRFDDSDALRSALAAAERETGVPHFAERYIEGREFNLSLVAGADGRPEALPAAEIVFDAFPEGKPRIVGYQAKWSDDSFESRATPRRFDFPVSDGPLLAELTALALRCWGVFGLRGYARVDFRVDGAGRAWILETNANPCLAPGAGFLAAAERGGIDPRRVVERILADALA